MKKHVIIGSAICLATVLILGLFWGKHPYGCTNSF